MRTLARLAAFTTSFAALAFALGPAGSAQTLSRNPRPPRASTGAAGPVLPLNSVSITQSTSLTPTVASSVSCRDSGNGTHTDNSYWRVFTLASFPALDSTYFTVQSVDVGIESANAAGTGTTQPVTLRLHSQDTGTFPGGTRTLLRTETVEVTDQALTLLNVALATPVSLPNATGVLAVELFTPSGQLAGHSFFVGANASGQTGPGYLSAAACGIPTPTDLAALGFPAVHLVVRVNGQNQLTPVELQRFTAE